MPGGPGSDGLVRGLGFFSFGGCGWRGLVAGPGAGGFRFRLRGDLRDDRCRFPGVPSAELRLFLRGFAPVDEDERARLLGLPACVPAFPARGLSSACAVSSAKRSFTTFTPDPVVARAPAANSIPSRVSSTLIPFPRPMNSARGSACPRLASSVSGIENGAVPNFAPCFAACKSRTLAAESRRGANRDFARSFGGLVPSRRDAAAAQNTTQ
jgi:hypothetical protein